MGWARAKNISPGDPPGGSRWGTGGPQRGHFCRLHFPDSPKRPVLFSSYLLYGFLLGRGNFCDIQNGGIGGQNTPKIDPQNLALNPPKFSPPYSASTKNYPRGKFLGSFFPYPTVKRAREYLPPIRKYGAPNMSPFYDRFWSLIGNMFKRVFLEIGKLLTSQNLT